MSAAEDARNITLTLLEKLGFHADVTVSGEDEHTLMLDSAHNELLMGKNGDRLDDLQYLVNRILRKTHPEAGRVRIDCEGLRERREEELVEKSRAWADRVVETGEQRWTQAMNSYERRLVHNALVDHPGVTTSSEEINSRLKKILIQPVA